MALLHKPNQPNYKYNDSCKGHLTCYFIVTDKITDEELDQYVTEELFPFWEKLGKALKLPGYFLDDTYNDYPADPAERLKVILREWQAKADHPTVAMLDKRLEQLGNKNLIPQHSIANKLVT